MPERTRTTNLDDEKAEPLGDIGDGDTGVPEDEQGISNRAGDKAGDRNTGTTRIFDELEP